MEWSQLWIAFVSLCSWQHSSSSVQHVANSRKFFQLDLGLLVRVGVGWVMCRHVASFEGAGCACLAAASIYFDWIVTRVMGNCSQLIILSLISETCFTLEGEMEMGGPVLLLRWPSSVCSFSPVLLLESLVLLFILVFPFPTPLTSLSGRDISYLFGYYGICGFRNNLKSNV